MNRVSFRWNMLNMDLLEDV